MRKLASATLILAISACTQAPPSSSPLANSQEQLLATIERTEHSGCPHTALRLHKAAMLEREAIQSNSVAALEQSTQAVIALANICKLERENCGTGPARLGMTTEQAIHTAWCFPDEKNTTEIAGHIREQWISRGRGYLYFDNGQITAIHEETP
jgi:hypothetical protein